MHCIYACYLGISRHQQNGEFGADALHMTGKLGARHVWHEMIGKDDSERLITFEHPHRLFSRTGFDHGEAEIGEHVCGAHARQFLVIDKEGYSAVGNIFLTPEDGGRLVRFLGTDWEP